VIVAGVATYVVFHDDLAVGRDALAACAGCVVAAGLLAGLQFEGWLDRRATTIVTVVLAAALTVTLRAAATDAWVIHASLNALALSTLLHVAVGRRWPFAA
jgi:hypothetical protein